MKRITVSIVIMIATYFAGCKEEGRLDYIDYSVPAPACVTVEEVIDKPGGAVIKYRIPNDGNLLGVKVVYTRNGEMCESKASKYVDTLVVEGLGNTEPQVVQLYSIGVNDKVSEPVSATINPKTPPVHSVKFDMEEGFGGVSVSLRNNYTNAELALVLLFDTLGVFSGDKRQWLELHTFHTKADSIRLSRRDLRSRPIDLALYVRDRWGNVSDTVFKNLTPIEEIKLPKDKFFVADLPTDYGTKDSELAGGNPDHRMTNLWTGEETPDYHIFATSNAGKIPQWFTIGLGHKMSINRLQIWPRLGYEMYSGSAPREFEIWGSADPNPDGSWDNSWTLLGKFEQYKPSGYGEGRDVGPITDEDRDYFYYHSVYEFMPSDLTPNPYMTVTHVRFKILSTFFTYGSEMTGSEVIMCEIAFWGQLKDES
jgi:hypothetical protein